MPSEYPCCQGCVSLWMFTQSWIAGFACWSVGAEGFATGIAKPSRRAIAGGGDGRRLACGARMRYLGREAAPVETALGRVSVSMGRHACDACGTSLRSREGLLDVEGSMTPSHGGWRARRLLRELAALGYAPEDVGAYLGDGTEWLRRLYRDWFPNALRIVDFFHRWLRTARRTRPGRRRRRAGRPDDCPCPRRTSGWPVAAASPTGRRRGPPASPPASLSAFLPVLLPAFLPAILPALLPALLRRPSFAGPVADLLEVSTLREYIARARLGGEFGTERWKWYRGDAIAPGGRAVARPKVPHSIKQLMRSVARYAETGGSGSARAQPVHRRRRRHPLLGVRRLRHACAVKRP